MLRTFFDVLKNGKTLISFPAWEATWFQLQFVDEQMFQSTLPHGELLFAYNPLKFDKKITLYCEHTWFPA